MENFHGESEYESFWKLWHSRIWLETAHRWNWF